MAVQARFLLQPHALVTYGIQRLQHVPRYVEAMKARLELLETDPDREAHANDQVREAMKIYQGLLDRLPKDRHAPPQVKDLRWQIEEFKVSLFAQQLGTARSVSLQRIRKAADKIR